jgi:L-asparaginase
MTLTRKKVRIISTGGTIAEGRASARERRHQSAADMLHSLGVGVEAELSVLDLFDVPSTFMTFEHMTGLTTAVRSAGTEGMDGVVVTHGTDTLEESAYFIDLTAGLDVPVVVTGAMLPPTLPGSDASVNLQDAIRVATSASAVGLGVLVAMAGQIHPARDVRKAHSTRATAFTSGEFGPVGVIEEGRVSIVRHVVPTAALAIEHVTARVEAIKCYAAMTDLLLQALVAAKVDGIVLETLGSGQVPPWTMGAIREATRAGITVTATTRCAEGRLIREHHGLPDRTEGDERDLLEAGVLFSDLQGVKARLRLAVGLSAGLSPKELREWF